MGSKKMWVSPEGFGLRRVKATWPDGRSLTCSVANGGQHTYRMRRSRAISAYLGMSTPAWTEKPRTSWPDPGWSSARTPGTTSSPRSQPDGPLRSTLGQVGGSSKIGWSLSSRPVRGAHQVGDEAFVDAVGDVANIAGTRRAGRDEAQLGLEGRADVETVDRDDMDVHVEIQGRPEGLREGDGPCLAARRRVGAVETEDLFDEDL